MYLWCTVNVFHVFRTTCGSFDGVCARSCKQRSSSSRNFRHFFTMEPDQPRKSGEEGGQSPSFKNTARGLMKIFVDVLAKTRTFLKWGWRFNFFNSNLLSSPWGYLRLSSTKAWTRAGVLKKTRVQKTKKKLDGLKNRRIVFNKIKGCTKK